MIYLMAIPYLMGMYIIGAIFGVIALCVALGIVYLGDRELKGFRSAHGFKSKLKHLILPVIHIAFFAFAGAALTSPNECSVASDRTTITCLDKNQKNSALLERFAIGVGVATTFYAMGRSTVRRFLEEENS